MMNDEKYIRRCLQLAVKGKGYTMPNPLVGAVIVDNGEIIGEGYHKRYGDSHAEVNAINSVVDRSRLKTSTIYVSLEPCAHYGKTPPCADLIIRSGIPKVVVAIVDSNPSVSGRGIKMMEDAGVEVVIGVLEKEAYDINKRFFVNQNYKRPYIILKWAQSADGFIDRVRELGDGQSAIRLSNEISSAFVHKLRTEVQGIIVGTNTALMDNPKLTSRNWYGNNPTRIVIDREGKLPSGISLFDGEVETILFCESFSSDFADKRVKSLKIDFSVNIIPQILQHLYEEDIYSILVEGGSSLLSSFIEGGYWDEAYVEVAPIKIGNGVKAPALDMSKSVTKYYKKSTQYHLKNKITQNIV